MSLTATQIAGLRWSVGDSMGDTVAVETYAGDSAYGPLYAASVNVVCNVQRTRQLVRNGNGEEVLSELTLQVASGDESKFTDESRVTIDGRASTVLLASPKTYKGQVVYVEVTCK